MSTDDLPNLAETSITDLWRYHQEHADAATYHGAHRSHAKAEVLRRAAEQDARILGTEAGDITITYPSSYAYSTARVDGEFFALVQRDGLEKEWNQFVSHSYKIVKTWLNRLKGRGPEYRAVIEAMTIASTGSPALAGPSLEELSDYAPEGEES